MDAFAGFGLNLIPLASMVFLWKTAFNGAGFVSGVTQNQMVVYSVLAIALKDVFYFRTQDNLLAGVQRGDIAIDFLRPYNILGRFLSEDVAASTTTLFRRCLPLLLFSAIFIAPPLPSSFCALILFVVSCFFGYCILWLLSALTGLLAFWSMEIGNLGMVKDAIVRILSGSIVPIWFFPKAMQNVLDFLPFKYTFQTPLGIFIGKTQMAQSLKEIAIQALWTGCLGLTVYLAWGFARKKLLIQGG
jgi:ABC-2 type transport system permease protein